MCLVSLLPWQNRRGRSGPYLTRSESSLHYACRQLMPPVLFSVPLRSRNAQAVALQLHLWLLPLVCFYLFRDKDGE